MPAHPLPVRAALIGLSSTAITSWASGAHLPGLLSDTGRSKIKIAALLNSSTSAAEAAIKAYKLPAETKAYGTPQDLAHDPDIDLVICNTRVDKHLETILPSVKAGKDVYVEWPIASNLGEIEDLVNAAKESGARVAVGLQRRWIPAMMRLRELLSNGQGDLGKVLSTEIRAYGGSIDREILPTGLKYFAQREVGGNPIVIGFGHAFDSILSVIGEIDPSTVQTKAQLQRPNIPIRDNSTNKIVEHITSDVPDLLALHGTLVPSNVSAPNATLSFFFRRGQPFPGTPSLSWSINCERGEIRVISPASMTLDPRGDDPPVSIQVHRFDTNEVKDVEFDWSERQKPLPAAAKSVSECLYAFAEGRAEGDGWAGLKSAADRAKLIDSFFEGI